MKELVSINGEISSLENAKISIFDRGFLYGDAIYEVTRSYGRILFELESHVNRLYNSAKAISMKLPLSQIEMISHLYDIYKKVDCENVYMRIQISRGGGKIGMSQKLPPHVNEVVIIYPFVPIDKKSYVDGVPVFVTERLRNSKKALDPNIKSGNYLNNVLAYIEGENHGAFETFMVNQSGNITEGTTSNIFIVKNGKLITPPIEFDILQGITRQIIIGLARKNGIEVIEEGFDLKATCQAEEVFLTSSTREMVPISSVNGFHFNVKNYQVLPRLIKLYKSHIESYCQIAKDEHPWK